MILSSQSMIRVSTYSGFRIVLTKITVDYIGLVIDKEMIHSNNKENNWMIRVSIYQKNLSVWFYPEIEMKVVFLLRRMDFAYKSVIDEQ